MPSPAVPRAVMRVASRKFCAAVRTLHTPQTIAQMTLTGMLWNPDLLQAGSMIPVYRLQGARP